MAKGENIFHRKDGRWEARYIKGYELSGKIKYGFCYGKTYREAKEKVTKYKAALVNGKAVPTNTAKHRVAYYCNEWLRLKKGKIRESPYIKYSTVLEKHVKPKLGGCFPLGISTGVIDDFIITFNLRIFLCNLFENGKEHAIGHFQDIGLVYAGHFFPVMSLRILKRITNNAGTTSRII